MLHKLSTHRGSVVIAEPGLRVGGPSGLFREHSDGPSRNVRRHMGLGTVGGRALPIAGFLPKVARAPAGRPVLAFGLGLCAIAEESLKIVQLRHRESAVPPGE